MTRCINALRLVEIQPRATARPASRRHHSEIHLTTKDQTMNLTPAPAILAPSAAVLSELARHIEQDNAEGMRFAWDAVHQVFLTVIVQQGLIVHWTVEPARDRAEADAVRQRAVQAAVVSAMAMASTLPDHEREQLQQRLAAVGRVGPAH